MFGDILKLGFAILADGMKNKHFEELRKNAIDFKDYEVTKDEIQKDVL